jgi:hypothetical protein
MSGRKSNSNLKGLRQVRREPIQKGLVLAVIPSSTTISIIVGSMHMYLYFADRGLFQFMPLFAYFNLL